MTPIDRQKLVAVLGSQFFGDGHPKHGSYHDRCLFTYDLSILKSLLTFVSYLAMHLRWVPQLLQVDCTSQHNFQSSPPSFVSRLAAAASTSTWRTVVNGNGLWKWLHHPEIFRVKIVNIGQPFRRLRMFCPGLSSPLFFEPLAKILLKCIGLRPKAAGGMWMYQTPTEPIVAIEHWGPIQHKAVIV